NHLPYQIVTTEGTVAAYTYNAVNAPISKALGNGVTLTAEYDNRYRITKHEWKYSSTTFTGYSYGYDSVGNRLYSEDLVVPSKSEHFTFDNLDRMTNFDEGTLNGGKTAITSPTFNQNWTLDNVGNWSNFTDNGSSSNNTFTNTHEMTAFKGQAI